ncbi:MAG: glycosyltransferase family 2 protein [Betaproteobacteria bacterium]|nr:glycosyltransferase family 2 protein [Betaproteobacteria bacterium]
MSQQRPLVSVGVPTFNRPEQLDRALAELSSQTYENIEIVVSDNCSPGNATDAVIRRHVTRDSRIIHHKQSSPIPAIENFRFVLRQARGKYFLWATDDDQRKPEFIASLVLILEADECCVLAYSDASLTRDGKIVQYLNSVIDTTDSDPMVRAQLVLLNQNLNNEICGVFRREALLAHDFPKFYGSDHAILVYAAMEGHIRKGPAGLFALGLGGMGNSSDGVIRALGLSDTWINRYFGTLSQAVKLYAWLKHKFRLDGQQRLRVAFVLIKRVLLNPVYRNDLILGMYRLLKDLWNTAKRRSSNLAIFRNRVLRRIGIVADYFRIASRVRKNMLPPNTPRSIRGRILLVSMEGMNHFIAVLWGVVCWGLRSYGYEIHVVSLSRAFRNNMLYRLFRIPVISFDKLRGTYASLASNTSELRSRFTKLRTFREILSFEWQSLPLGKYAISTYCREHRTGEVNVEDPATIAALAEIAVTTNLNYLIAKEILSRMSINKAFFTELNTDSYGGFYLAALELGVDIVRWTSSNRDDAFFLQHLNRDFHSWHHSSLSPKTWVSVRKETFLGDRELDEFFAKRYGGAWAVFSRNYRGTKDVSSEEIRKWLGIENDKKIAIIYSHILYDTLYFYGTDLFESYADWLVHTVRAACKNDRLTWLIKIHPSNIWRGENKSGEYEEEVLIRKHIGPLPKHVQLIPPNTPFSPVSWMRFADIGVTVRGTAGLEMAMMGKIVVTAGTGRYDRSGFTTDPGFAEEYLSLLSQCPELESMTSDQISLARQYMHAVFLRKAFVITSLESGLATGQKDLTQYNDLLLLPSNSLRSVPPAAWPDVQSLAKWLEHPERKDYLIE